MLRLYSRHNYNRVTVVGDYFNNVLRLSVSRCSDKDNFSKKIGSLIAGGRFNKGIYCQVVEVDIPNTENFVKHASMLADTLVDSPKMVCNRVQ